MTSAAADKTTNEYADYWRYELPADTKNRIPLVKWSEWQDKPIPKELHDKWKSENEFSK